MFSRAVCLNVDKRFGEQERIRKDFARFGIGVEFFVAGDGQTLPRETYDHVDVAEPSPEALRSGYPWRERLPSYNAFLCFKQIVKKAREDACESLLLLEDDVTLDVSFGYGVGEALKQAGKKHFWDMMYLGGNHTWGVTYRVHDNLLRVEGTLCFHAVALRHSVYDAVLALPLGGPIDLMAARFLHRNYRCYAVWPNLALQRPGYSYCDRKEANYQQFWSSLGTHYDLREELAGKPL